MGSNLHVFGNYDTIQGYNRFVRRNSVDSTQISAGFNYCLDVYAYGGPGSRVVTWPCNDADNQKWIYDDIQRLHPAHRPDLCLDISGASDATGAYLVVWWCHGGSNQQWFTYAPIVCPSGTSPTSNGNCVCSVGTRVSIIDGQCKPCIPHDAMSYDIDNIMKAFTALGQAPFDGYTGLVTAVLGNVVSQSHCTWDIGYTIRNINSNACLSIEDGYCGDFGAIIQYDCNDNSARTAWRFEKVGSGPYFKIISCLSPTFVGPKCLSTGYGAGYTNVRLRSREKGKCGDDNVDAQFLLLPKGDDLFLLYSKGTGECFGLASDGYLRTKACNFNDSSQWMSIYSKKTKGNVNAKSAVCGSV